MSKLPHQDAKKIWQRVKDPSLDMIKRIVPFNGKQYEIGEVVALGIEPSIRNMPFAYFSDNPTRIYKTSTNFYDEDYHNWFHFVIFNKKLVPVKGKAYDRGNKNEFEYVLRYIPVYDLVKLDDPAKIAYEVPAGKFKKL